MKVIDCLWLFPLPLCLPDHPSSLSPCSHFILIFLAPFSPSAPFGAIVIIDSLSLSPTMVPLLLSFFVPFLFDNPHGTNRAFQSFSFVPFLLTVLFCSPHLAIQFIQSTKPFFVILKIFHSSRHFSHGRFSPEYIKFLIRPCSLARRALTRRPSSLSLLSLSLCYPKVKHPSSSFRQLLLFFFTSPTSSLSPALPTCFRPAPPRIASLRIAPIPNLEKKLLSLVSKSLFSTDSTTDDLINLSCHCA